MKFIETNLFWLLYRAFVFIKKNGSASPLFAPTRAAFIDNLSISLTLYNPSCRQSAGILLVLQPVYRGSTVMARHCCENLMAAMGTLSFCM